jgi:purine-binding chemotaxis protein CheW
MEVKNGEKVSSYLIFGINGEYYGSHVKDVLNILEFMKITPLPKSPAYLKGVVNLRGLVLPVVDTGIIFGLNPIEVSTNTSIIVMDIKTNNGVMNVGLLVDSVQSVQEVAEESIMPPPEIGNTNRIRFLTGMIHLDEHFVMILDPESLFKNEELKEIESVN